MFSRTFDLTEKEVDDEIEDHMDNNSDIEEPIEMLDKGEDNSS